MRFIRKYWRKFKSLFTKGRVNHPAPIQNGHSSPRTSTKLLEKLETMFYSCAIASGKWGVKAENIAYNIEHNFYRYKEVSEKTGVPVEVIGAIHSLESDLDFRTVLHNGERIIGKNRKTRLVPKGRGPFETWEEAAIDALKMKKNIMPKKWAIGETLNFLEKFNGLGYRKYHKDVNSPYLWSGTTCYTKGKYVADGKFSPTAVSKQVGAVAILKYLNYKAVSE